eukprot:1139974-Pelagomonas_calceolata.AAC.1
MQPMLLKGRVSFSTCAVPKLKDLELLSLLEEATGRWREQGSLLGRHAWEPCVGKAGQTCSRKS